MGESMLDVLFGSNLRAKTVGWLFGHPDEEFYVSEIAARTGVPVSNLSLELKKLEKAGFLDMRQVGVHRYYQARRTCPIFDELRGMAVKTAGLADILRQRLAGAAGVEVAFVYGSVAAGRATGESDIDLLVIGPASFADVVGALEGAREQLGRQVNIRAYSEEEFRRKASSGSGFFAEVLKGSKLFIVGGAERLGGIIAGTATDAPRPDRP